MKTILELFMVMITIACSSLASANKTVPGESLSSKTITSADKTWQLKLNVQPKIKFTLILEGHEFSQEAAVLQLYKVPDPALNGTSNLSPHLVWTVEKTPHFGDAPKTWSGDIFVDKEANQLYLAVSDGYSLEIYLTNANATTKPIPLRDTWTRVSPAILNAQNTSERGIYFPPNKLIQFGKIEKISIFKQENTLIATLEGQHKSKQQWSYSFAKQEWSRIAHLSGQ